jgi:hypothetical protein
MEVSLDILMLLLVASLLAGWVDSIAGGGGLITIPALLLAGLSPATALATNKLQGSSGTLTAAIYFIRRGTVDLRAMRMMIAMTLLGSIAGTWLVLYLQAEFLIRLLPWLLVLVGLYFLVVQGISDEDRHRRLSAAGFALVLAPLLGFYDGFFGPGTGSFFMLVLVSLCGYGLSRATAQTKVLNFTSNIGSLGYFLVFGDIAWTIGLVMVVGQVVGATIGARLVLSRGARLIRPVLVLVCFALAARLLWQG